MSLRDLIHAVEERRIAFSNEVQQLDQERLRYGAEVVRLTQARARNALELAGYLLPDLDDEDLLALEKRVAYPVLLGEKHKVEAELAAFDAERQGIEADPRFVEREVRRLDLEQQLAEIIDAYRAFRAERDVWESSDHFGRLRARGWFEPGYDGGLFDWLRDWRACSLLMAQLEKRWPDRKFPDDDDVRTAWRSHFADSEPVFELQRDLEAKRAEIDQLERRHALLLGKPAELYQLLYRKLGELLVEHLRESSEQLRDKLAKDDQVLGNMLKKDEGLKKQAAYLQELTVVRIDAQIQVLQAEMQKLARKDQKLRYKAARGKWVHDSDGAARAMRAIPQAKWDQRRLQHVKTRERVATFDRYDDGALVRDFLWWDLITRGARADDLYEVRTFHATHPGWSVAAFQDSRQAELAQSSNDLAAAAAVDLMLADDDHIALDAS